VTHGTPRGGMSFFLFQHKEVFKQFRSSYPTMLLVVQQCELVAKIHCKMLLQELENIRTMGLVLISDTNCFSLRFDLLHFFQRRVYEVLFRPRVSQHRFEATHVERKSCTIHRFDSIYCQTYLCDLCSVMRRNDETRKKSHSSFGTSGISFACI
jgi:hypothetical protein